ETKSQTYFLKTWPSTVICSGVLTDHSALSFWSHLSRAPAYSHRTKSSPFIDSLSDRGMTLSPFQQMFLLNSKFKKCFFFIS
uniref:Uncharacterized protein n=1 Tax=Seriola dumerili TaxID=41447 RepID=A0A3B4ULD8_SERDU